jgi:glycosyltransferase involved in cell wall biosynthesis
MQKLKISVIIPAKNSEKTIGKCLYSVLNQDHKSYEVIVVDGGSKDRTTEIAESYAAKVFQEPAHLGSAPGIGRNYGAKNANGDIYAFLDSDCYPERTWLTKVASVFNDKKFGIYGIIVRDLDGTIMSRAYHYLHMQISYDFAPSRCMAVRKEAFLQVKGFDKSLTSGEDNDLSYRVMSCGYKVMVDKDAKVYHDDDHLRSLKGIWKQQRWYFEAETKFRRKMPQRFRRFKTSAPLQEHLMPLVKAVWVGGLKFAVVCLLIKLMSVRRHL